MKLYLSILVCLLMTAAPRSVGAADNPAETNQKEGGAFLLSVLLREIHATIEKNTAHAGLEEVNQ